MINEKNFEEHLNCVRDLFTALANADSQLEAMRYLERLLISYTEEIKAGIKNNG